MNIGIIPGESFNRDILDDSWEIAAIQECHDNNYSNVENTLNGMAAEQFMIQYRGHINDPRKFRDTKYFNESVEIKSASAKDDDYFLNRRAEVLAELRHRKVVWGKDISDYVIFFKRNDRYYTCDSLWTFDWTPHMYQQSKVWVQYDGPGYAKGKNGGMERFYDSDTVT